MFIHVIVHVVKHQSVLIKAVEPENDAGFPKHNKVGGASKESVGANTTSVYPCRSCEISRAHVRANTEKMRDCHLVARTCDNEVGVAISIRDPYTSPFTSRCK